MAATPELGELSYEHKPTTRLKRYLKNVNPEYVKKRKRYGEQEDVRERRKCLNRRRRILSSNLINLAKNNSLILSNSTLPCEEPEKLKIIRGRLCTNQNLCLNVTKKGIINTMPYNAETELEEPKYDCYIDNDLSQSAFNKILTEYDEYVKKENLDYYAKETVNQFLKQRNESQPIGNGGKDSSSESGEC